jgi:hypothetical protein
MFAMLRGEQKEHSLHCTEKIHKNMWSPDFKPSWINLEIICIFLLTNSISKCIFVANFCYSSHYYQQEFFLFNWKMAHMCYSLGVIWVAFAILTVSCFCLLVFRDASDNLAVQNQKGSFSNASGIITNYNLNITDCVTNCCLLKALMTVAISLWHWK